VFGVGPVPCQCEVVPATRSPTLTPRLSLERRHGHRYDVGVAREHPRRQVWAETFTEARKTARSEGTGTAVLEVGAQSLAWIALCFYDPLTAFYILGALASVAVAALGSWVGVHELTTTMANSGSRGEFVGYVEIITLLVDAALLLLAIRECRENQRHRGP